VSKPVPYSSSCVVRPAVRYTSDNEAVAVLWLTAPPKVDLSALGGREIRVRAGDPLKIDVPISGAPTPTVTWQKDGKDLESSPRVCTLLCTGTSTRKHTSAIA